MVQITTDFGIQGPVDFLDVHVERDNLLFIDPSAIRFVAKQGDQYAQAADRSLTDFFDYVLQMLSSSNPVDRQAGEEALQQFSELKETRLGMSRSGFDGHGAAEELGTQIWEQLSTNPLCKHAIATLKYIEDVPLFVDGIDKDITSDLTARIILLTLEKFTTDMMTKHPEFQLTRPTTTTTTHYWDQSQKAWVPKTITLPEANGVPLLLVPKGIVNYKLSMTYGQYYGVPLLGYIKGENLMEVAGPKGPKIVARYTKKQLKAMPKYAKSRVTNEVQTVRIFQKDGVDVLGDYRKESQSNFVPLTDAELDERLERRP